MRESFERLPRLAFGEERAVLGQNLNAYRDRLAKVITGLSELDSIDVGPFQHKTSSVEINGLHLLANSRTSLHMRTNKPSELLGAFVLSGSGYFVFEGRRYDFHPGNIIYVPEGVRQAWSGPCSMMNMTLDRDRLCEAYKAIAGQAPDARQMQRLSVVQAGPGAAGDRLVEHVSAITHAIDMSRESPRSLEVLGLDQVLYRLVAVSIWPDLLRDRDAARASPHDMGERAMVARLRDHVHANLDKPLHLTSLAIVAGTSTRRVREMFLKAFGVTPAEYIRDARLVHARHLLETAPEKRIREISSELGFTRASLFAAQYRQRFGEPPVTTRSRAACWDKASS